jgi:hypothetical protein
MEVAAIIVNYRTAEATVAKLADAWSCAV